MTVECNVKKGHTYFEFCRVSLRSVRISFLIVPISIVVAMHKISPIYVNNFVYVCNSCSGSLTR